MMMPVQETQEILNYDFWNKPISSLLFPLVFWIAELHGIHFYALIFLQCY